VSVSCIAIGFLCFAHAYAVEPVVVYCSRKDDVAQSAAERFERETGTVVKVVWVDSQTRNGELPARLADDRGRSRADVFWSSDLTTAIALKSEGLSVPYESPNEKDVPASCSDPEHHWTGFPDEVRVIVYNKEVLGDPDDIPTSIFDMINPRFNAKVCMADPLSGTTALHAAALFQVLGEDMAEVFFSGLRTNKIAVVTSNREVVDRVAAGEFTIGLTDSRDFEAAAKEGKPIGAVFPDQQSYGTLIVPSALVLMANGPNPEQGRRFIDFLLRSEIQKLLGPTRETLTGSNIKPMEIDYVKLVAQAKELSRGFLKEWVDKQK